MFRLRGWATVAIYDKSTVIYGYKLPQYKIGKHKKKTNQRTNDYTCESNNSLFPYPLATLSLQPVNAFKVFKSVKYFVCVCVCGNRAPVVIEALAKCV